MTGNELFGLTMAVLSEEESDNADFRGRCVELINLMLQESFTVNQALRASRGLAELLQPPVLSSLSEEVPYEPELTRGAFPYGLAEKYAFDENDFQKIGYFNSLYANGVNAATRGKRSLVRDNY